MQIQFKSIQSVFQGSIIMRLDVSMWSSLGQILDAAYLFCFCSIKKKNSYHLLPSLPHSGETDDSPDN